MPLGGVEHPSPSESTYICTIMDRERPPRSTVALFLSFASGMHCGFLLYMGWVRCLLEKRKRDKTELRRDVAHCAPEDWMNLEGRDVSRERRFNQQMIGCGRLGRSKMIVHAPSYGGVSGAAARRVIGNVLGRQYDFAVEEDRKRQNVDRTKQELFFHPTTTVSKPQRSFHTELPVHPSSGKKIVCHFVTRFTFVSTYDLSRRREWMRASKVSGTGLFFCVFTLLRVSIAPLAVYRPPGMRRSSASATRIEGRPFESSTAKRPIEEQDRGKPVDELHPCPSPPMVVFANLGRTAAPVLSSAGLADAHRWHPRVSRRKGRDRTRFYTGSPRRGMAKRALRTGSGIACPPRLCRCDAAPRWARNSNSDPSVPSLATSLPPQGPRCPAGPSKDLIAVARPRARRRLTATRAILISSARWVCGLPAPIGRAVWVWCRRTRRRGGGAGITNYALVHFTVHGVSLAGDGVQLDSDYSETGLDHNFWIPLRLFGVIILLDVRGSLASAFPGHFNFSPTYPTLAWQYQAAVDPGGRPPPMTMSASAVNT
ncbi:hypothetical protein DFH06DRAFT_1153476 [Mycena polygramma]|nr:hypothetical protein DFH06DRAFT_1153476 [Mycena polygramma]